MPQTINKTADLQIIAGVFSDREKADKAIAAFQEAGVPAQNIQFVFQPDKAASTSTYVDDFQERGIAERQAVYYDKAITDGKLFVAVYNVTDPAPIVEIFDRFGAEYNPDGSRTQEVTQERFTVNPEKTGEGFRDENGNTAYRFRRYAGR